MTSSSSSARGLDRGLEHQVAQRLAHRGDHVVGLLRQQVVLDANRLCFLGRVRDRRALCAKVALVGRHHADLVLVGDLRGSDVANDRLLVDARRGSLRGILGEESDGVRAARAEDVCVQCVTLQPTSRRRGTGLQLLESLTRRTDPVVEHRQSTLDLVEVL